MTQRVQDINGWTYIAKNPISKAGVYPYGGFEIPGAPDPHRIYNVFRPPEELERSAASFALIPIRDDHLILGEQGESTDEQPIAGYTGEHVTYEHPYLYAPLKITSPKLKQQIDNGKIELSPAYFSTFDATSGVYEGQPYDYVQRIVAGNHLALVDVGRTGPDVAVLDGVSIVRDRYPFDHSREKNPMDIEELISAVAALPDEDKASLLSALAPAATDEDPTEEDMATDADLSDEADAAASAAAEAEAAEAAGNDVAAVQAAGEAVTNAEAVLAAAEELQDKISADAMTKAVRHIDARNAMLARVKPFVGSVPVAAQDSAESIAAYFLRQKGVKHAKGQAAAVASGYLHGRTPDSQQTVSQDARVAPADTATKIWKETA